MQTMLVKLDDGNVLFHFEKGQVYPREGYEGTLADFIVWLVEGHAPGRTAVEYGFVDSDALDAWCDDEAHVDRSLITIDSEHNVTLPE